MRSQNPLDDRLGGDAEMPVEVNPLMPTNIVFQPITIGCQPGIYITAIVLRKAHPNVVEPGSGSGPSSAGQSVSFFLAALRAKQIEKKVQPLRPNSRLRRRLGFLLSNRTVLLESLPVNWTTLPKAGGGRTRR
jgi:hypothetical protein